MALAEKLKLKKLVND